MNPLSICIGAGAALGLFALARKAHPRLMSLAIDAGLILELLALIGARLGYVLLHIKYFSAHSAEIPAFWLGGLSWIGAAAGLLMGMLALVWLFKISLPEAYWMTILLAMPLAVLTWLGCWTGGIGYGPAQPQPSWWAWQTMDETGRVSPRFPLQIFCAFLLTLVFALLETIPTALVRLRSKIPALAGFTLAADLLVFATLRADPVRVVLDGKVDKEAAAVLFLLSIAASYLAYPTSGKTRPGVS